MAKRLVILFCLLVMAMAQSFVVHGQDRINLLKKQLKEKKLADTTRVRLLMETGKEYRNTSKDSALRYINKAVKLTREKNMAGPLAEALYLKATVYYFASDFRNTKNILLLALAKAQKENDLNLISKNYNVLGAIAFNRGDYNEARKYYDLKLGISKKLKDTSSIIESYYNIALIYNQQADFNTAISWEYKSLKLAETFKDSSEIAYCAQGLGETFYRIEDYKSSRFYLNKARRIATARKDNYMITGLLIDEGNVYQALEKWDSSIIYYDEAIALSIISNDPYHQGIAITNKAISRVSQKKFSDAIMLFEQSLKISQGIDNQHGTLQNYIGLAKTYKDLEQYDNAYAIAHKTIKLANALEAPQELMEISGILYKLFDKRGRTDSALHYFKISMAIKDSLGSTTRINNIAGQARTYEREKAEQARAYEKKMNDAQIEKQQQIRNIFIISSIIIFIALIVLFRNFRQKQKANRAITEQKKIIEHKNKDILDSINYSKRIQHAILTPVEEVKKLLPHSFVLFKPKDIVSGDFYFIEPVTTSDGENLITLAMADCTGHGVPGAFMSIMAYNFLKQSLKEKSVNSSGQALDYVNHELISFLRLHQSKANLRDGMDIAFCAIYPNNTVNFAGANNPLWIVSKREKLQLENGREIPVLAQHNGYFLYEIKATKQHVGYNEKTIPFESQNVKLIRGEMAILFTDGYADQFGGEQGKKIKSRKFAGIVLENAHLEMEELGRTLNDFFEQWKGEHEQVDDVSVIGYRV